MEYLSCIPVYLEVTVTPIYLLFRLDQLTFYSQNSELLTEQFFTASWDIFQLILLMSWCFRCMQTWAKECRRTRWKWYTPPCKWWHFPNMPTLGTQHDTLVFTLQKIFVQKCPKPPRQVLWLLRWVLISGIHLWSDLLRGILTLHLMEPRWCDLICITKHFKFWGEKSQKPRAKQNSCNDL